MMKSFKFVLPLMLSCLHSALGLKECEELKSVKCSGAGIEELYSSEHFVV